MDDSDSKSRRLDQSYSFEEFRLMYESTEKVSDRKIDFTRNNITLCLAIIAGVGASVSWCYGKADLKHYLPIAIFLISTLSIIFCLYWNGQLKAFKDLNTAKFEVLEKMAERLIFPDYKDRTVQSINPFQLEYQILQRNKKLTQQNGALSFKSNMAETFVPKAFMWFFVILNLFSVFTFVHNINLVGAFHL